MLKRIAIVGAGLLGRLLAVNLVQQGCYVHVFDRDSDAGQQSCAYAAAGMLSPISELETSEYLIYQLGQESLRLWPSILAELKVPVFFRQAGTLVVAHRQEAHELVHLKRRILAKLQAGENPLQDLTLEDIAQLEPMLSGRFQAGVFIPEEGQMDNRQLLLALAQTLHAHQVPWETHVILGNLVSYRIETQGCSESFDWVIDCRGLGAKTQWPDLRGVRGEIITVVAPEITLNRPVRLMHPRYPLYVVPREAHHFLIGATSIESADFRPMTVQSALELLSAAYSLHPGFAEATITEMAVNCRPSLPHNLPRIRVEPGLMRINGLYRHGFLLAPKLVQLATDYLLAGSVDPAYRMVFEEIPYGACCD